MRQKKKMVQVRFEIDEKTKRVLDMVKGKYGLRNRSEALEKFVKKYGRNETGNCEKGHVIREDVQDYGDLNSQNHVEISKRDYGDFRDFKHEKFLEKLKDLEKSKNDVQFQKDVQKIQDDFKHVDGEMNYED